MTSFSDIVTEKQSEIATLRHTITEKDKQITILTEERDQAVSQLAIITTERDKGLTLLAVVSKERDDLENLASTSFHSIADDVSQDHCPVATKRPSSDTSASGSPKEPRGPTDQDQETDQEETD